jgi:hypothetical protein
MSEIKFETEMEKFLYNERKIMMKERDEALEKVEDLKKKAKGEFSCIMYNIFTEQDTKSNGGFHHPTFKGTMHIKKNGCMITLDADEIKEVVHTAGGNFRR